MSASEKLRALEPIYITVAELGETEHTLYDVPLPLIADVIEAAETVKLPNPVFFREAYEGEADQFMPSVERLVSALTALEAHLTPEHPGPCDTHPIKDWGA